MSPSPADNVNLRKMHACYIVLERNASSRSTESAEFEFDSGSFLTPNDELPLSPKLLYSPNYTLNYSPDGEIRALMASNNQFYDIHASKTDYVRQHQGPINHENHANAAEEIRQRTNLRSLLNRSDLEQLPPLTSHQIDYKDIKKQVPVERSSPASTSSSSLSASPSSSPINYRANHSTNPCTLEDFHPVHAGHTSPPERKSCQKNSRKWAFKLDFLRKGPSPRVGPAINQSSNDKHNDYSINHDMIRIAAEPADVASLHERDNDAAAAGELGDARFNQQINQSMTRNHRTADAAREAKFSDRIDNYRMAAAVITKFESSRQSTCSVIGSVSRSPRHADNEMIWDNHTEISKSAPISPAGTPPRSLHGEEGAFRAPPRTRCTISSNVLATRTSRKNLSCLTANIS